MVVGCKDPPHHRPSTIHRPPLTMRVTVPLLGIILVFGAASPSHARRAWDKHEPGLTLEMDLDYDGSRARTNAFHFGPEIEWGTKEFWINLSLDTYTDFQSGWRFRSDVFSTLECGKALWRDDDARLYINATLQLDAHSYLAMQGGDITPEINIAKGITKDWWIGGAVNGVFATDPDPGDRAGYGSLTLWLRWLCGWLPDESDSIALSVWAATNEVRYSENALFISLEYQFDLTEKLEAKVGIGTDPYTPWDHLGIYGTAGLTWRW